MLSSSELTPPAITLSHSDSKSFCRSQTSSHSTPDPLLHAQIAQLKEKAHQSFMQVMQMQQLHEEQLQLLRTEQTQREEGLHLRIREFQERMGRQEELELRVQQLENENSAMERNYKLRFCEMEDDLSIDSVELIPGKQGEMDDEEMSHLREVLELYAREEEFQAIKVQMISEVHQMLGTSNGQEISSSGSGSGGSTPNSPLLQLTNKVLTYVSSLRTEWSKLLLIQRQRQEKENINEETVKEPPTTHPLSGKEIERLEREGKFMADHIKRLSTEKLRAEKRAAESERQLKILQEKMVKVTAALLKKGMHLDELPLPQGKTGGLLEHDHSLELDEFVSENMRNSCNSPPISSPSKSHHHHLLAKTNKR